MNDDGFDKQIVFLVGTPRSGTTWLQILLGSHPDIATGRETHLFSRYVSGIWTRFFQDERNIAGEDGLKAYFDDDAFQDDLLRPFALTVLRKIAERKPGARYVLEKTPNHLRQAALIKQLLPDARFLLMVRDPRGVAASHLAAMRESWGGWARKSAGEAAKLWISDVEEGLRLQKRYADDVSRVRFEDLYADREGTLGRLADWLGVRPDGFRDAIARSAAELDAERLALNDPADPRYETRDRFFRRGDPEGWRSQLSADQRATIELYCAGGMAKLGYPI